MTYDAQFFKNIGDASQRSAEVIVPKFNQLIQPTSVVDVGCGKGWFLAEFIKHGVTDVAGIDGTAPDGLAIDDTLYAQTDLTQPWPLARTFDLALCLEVAEHLPETAAAEFIRRLCLLAPVVLFSAAIPMQGGEGHVNERWPEYWKCLFGDHGYVGSGWPRIDLWGDERVAAYYRQNLLLFVDREHIGPTPASWELKQYVESTPPFSMYRLVHPELFGEKMGVKFL